MSASDTKTVVFAGGGTGGHLLPGIAVAVALRERGLAVRSVFVGSAREIERQIVCDHGFEHIALPVEPSSIAWKRPVYFANRMWRSALAAKEVLPRCAASAVVGLGGYASVPLVWAARLAKIPVMLLEQNAVPGRATSWLCRRADLTCLGFSDAVRRLPKSAPTVVTGNPVRAEISQLASAGGSQNGRTLLVLGGSQGSVALNDAFVSCVERFPASFAGWMIVHQTGRRDGERVAARYAAIGRQVQAAPYFAELAPHYGQAALAISRAGALTLSELACAGVPAILIPYRQAIRNHQRLNAYMFEHIGAARVVRQSQNADITSGHLQEQLDLLMNKPDLRARMSRAIRSLAKPEATSLVADEVTRMLNGKQNPTGDELAT